MVNRPIVGRRIVLAGAMLVPFRRVLAQATLPTLRPETFGAKGDGKTDDTTAFQAMARQIEDQKGGTVSLRRGAIYRLGRQIRGKKQDPVYIAETMFSVKNVNGLTIAGNGATLKLNDGLRYGSFDPATGGRFDPPSGKFTNPDYAASIGGMIAVTGSRGVRISGLTLDGNADKLIVGGRWNVDIQLHADGLQLLDVADVSIENLTTRDHGLDGVYLRGRTRKAPAHGADAIRFANLRTIGNGRQGVSVIGGSGVRFTDCLFADTGQGAIQSAPSAGVDIEPNGSDWASDLLFERCEFRNNRGVGLLTGGGASRDIVARDCTFWQGFAKGARTGGSSDAFWLVAPGIVVEGCKVHGNVTNLAVEAVVRRSSFDDATLPGYGHAAQRRRYLLAGVRGTFEYCTFTVSTPGMHALVYATKSVTFRNCRMRFAGQALPTNLAAAVFGSAATLENVHFSEALRNPTPAGNYIAADSPTLLGQVVVDGPHIRWGGKKGQIGNVSATSR